jgi:anti-sigma factor RsiW
LTTPADGLPEMPCQEFVERVTDYLEDALPPEDRTRLEAHLEECAACSLYLEQLGTTLGLAGELREEDVSPEMRAELLGVFARWRSAG